MDDKKVNDETTETNPKETPNDDENEKSNEKDNASSSQEKCKIDGPFSMSQINSGMTPKEAYFELLRTWINQANMSQSAMACFPYYLMANYPQLFQGQQQQQQTNGGTASGGAGRNTINQNQFRQNVAGIRAFRFPIAGNILGLGGGIGGIRAANERRFGDYFDNDLRQAQEELINQNGGYEFIIAPFWKRFVAEVIDSLILLILKLILTFTIVDLFDLNLGIELSMDMLKKSMEDDYSEVLSLSSDLLLIEILTKVVVCFYEAVWTTSGHIYVGGATPGKIIMGIRIVYAEAVIPLPPLNNNGTQLRALLFPATNPGFKRALLRAIAKNILMALLFPMCFIMLFFKNNRTAYDVMTKTIVVEENPAPILRRR